MQTNDILKALDIAKTKILYADTISKLHTCNDCGLRDCVHRPKLGDTVRINCFAWSGEFTKNDRRPQKG